MFYAIQFCSHVFNHELTVLNGPIDVLMRNSCEIDVFYDAILSRKSIG